ncbi:MAG: hypothetical protein ACR2HV_12180 [Acidimicrobiales bacterium]
MAWFLLKLGLAIVVFVAIMRVGMLVLSALARPNEPPPPWEMRKVNLRYRCSICHTEVRMTQAAEELPLPERHCQEDMELMSPTLK